MPADARWLAAGDLSDFQLPFGATHREEWLPTDASVEKFLRRPMGAIPIQAEFMNELSAVGAVDHHRIGVAAAMEQVYGTGEQPVSKTGQPAVVLAHGGIQVPGDDYHIVAIAHFGD